LSARRPALGAGLRGKRSFPPSIGIFVQLSDVAHTIDLSRMMNRSWCTVIVIVSQHRRASTESWSLREQVFTRKYALKFADNVANAITQFAHDARHKF
jgi:hypothetical protein